MKNKKGQGMIGTALLIVVIIVAFVLLNLYMSNTYYHSCLEEEAKSYCESINKEYSGHAYFVFSCKEDSRELGGKFYRFLSEEKAECKSNENNMS